MNLKKIHNPSLFQGHLRRKNYFEGWYMKQVSEDERTVISFIPGVSLFDSDRHSFVQYILSYHTQDGLVSRTGYIRHDVEDFNYDKDSFAVQIGKSSFSGSGLSVELDDDGFAISGILKYGSLEPIRRSLWMPNIMGPFAYLTFMECNHGLVSMSHTVTGRLEIVGNPLISAMAAGISKKTGALHSPENMYGYIPIIFRCPRPVCSFQWR